MTTIEIPKVETLEGIGDPCEHIITVFHFLLTSLLSRNQALLHAEYRRPEAKTTWYLRPRAPDLEGEDEPLVVLPSGILLSCAARLALVLDLSHKEGGRGRFELVQGKRRHDCHVFLSNCKESGHWIRVYGETV